MSLRVCASCVPRTSYAEKIDRLKNKYLRLISVVPACLDMLRLRTWLRMATWPKTARPRKQKSGPDAGGDPSCEEQEDLDDDDDDELLSVHIVHLCLHQPAYIYMHMYIALYICNVFIAVCDICTYIFHV